MSTLPAGLARVSSLASRRPRRRRAARPRFAARHRAAHAQGCPDIEVVFARGTDEPPGLGRVGQAFVDALSGRVGGRSVGSYAVIYPATYDFLAAADGANDASAHIQYMMAELPGTRLVLGGYSQGAAVIDVIAAVPLPGGRVHQPRCPPTPPTSSPRSRSSATRRRSSACR